MTFILLYVTPMQEESGKSGMREYRVHAQSHVVLVSATCYFTLLPRPV